MSSSSSFATLPAAMAWCAVAASASKTARGPKRSCTRNARDAGEFAQMANQARHPRYYTRYGNPVHERVAAILAGLGFAQQDGNPVFSLCQRGFERGDRGPGLFQIGPRLIDVQRRGQPGLIAPVGDLQGLGLGREVVACDAQASLGIAYLDVVQRELRCQRDLRGVQVGDTGFQIGAGPFQAAPLAAEARVPCRRLETRAPVFALCKALRNR